MGASLDLAAPKLGSGARFAKLSGALAARGAKDPDALAAYIGRKKFGAKKFGKLSAHAHAHSNEDDLGIYLAAMESDSGKTLTCPGCGYSGPASRFSASSADGDSGPAVLRTPAPSTGGVREGAPLTVRGGGAHALSNTREALELAAGVRRVPVAGPHDVGFRRADSMLYHRRSGADIARMRRNEDGTWTAVVAGRELQPHVQQRAALLEAVGTYNAAVNAGTRRQEAPLQPPPQQTELMAEYGIPAMRSAAFATPTAGASDGPRMTTAGGKGKTYDPDNDGDNDASVSGDTDKDGPGGLSPKGQAIYKRLIAKGFTPARALAFARNSEKAKSGAFGKAAA